MSRAKHACPECGQRISIPDVILTKELGCPRCKTKFVPNDDTFVSTAPDTRVVESSSTPSLSAAATANLDAESSAATTPDASAPKKRVKGKSPTPPRTEPSVSPAPAPALDGSLWTIVAVVALVWAVGATAMYVLSRQQLRANQAAFAELLETERKNNRKQRESLEVSGASSAREASVASVDSPRAARSGSSALDPEMLGLGPDPDSDQSGPAMNPETPLGESSVPDAVDGSAQPDPVAASSGNDLEEIRKRYEGLARQCLSEYDSERADVREPYLAKLRELGSSAQKSGNLDGVLAIKREIERFAADSSLTHDDLVNAPDSLRKLQASVMVKFSGLTTGYESKRRSLDQKYLERLNLLEKNFTKSGKLEQALKVRNEKKRFGRSAMSQASR